MSVTVKICGITRVEDAWAGKRAGAGGTGARFNWEIAVQARKLGRPIFLAGGLNPSNVAEAVRQVQPYGVDVSSGVEAAPGIKDAAKINAFVTSAKDALRDIGETLG